MIHTYIYIYICLRKRKMQGYSLCKYVDLGIQSEICSCRIDIKDPVLGTQRHQWKSPNDR